ncbi:hypothetical protein KY285_022003 [Solanum tuberosum]|nr:hypothetical protein KY285_022003 [Solanum tuberosum]
MDLFIWGPPYFQDENSFPANSLAQNFYFSQKFDIIEEDALNEKCCVQVLEILIAKADTEIAELEDDIVMLQSQLSRTDERWLDMCIAALNKKIDRLGSLITALKIENVQASGVHLKTNKKPSERIHEILETPPRNFSSPRDKQTANSTIGSSKLAASVRVKVEAADNHNLKDIETVETNGESTVPGQCYDPDIICGSRKKSTRNTTAIDGAVNVQDFELFRDEHAITKGSCTKSFGHASDTSTLKDLNESDIPGKLINASKRENPSQLNNFACAVLKSASTKLLRDKAEFCGESKRKINMSEDLLEDELMQQGSNDSIIIKPSLGVKQTSIGEGPKPAGAIVVTRLSAVKQEPKESGDEQAQNGAKAGQTREKHTSSQLGEGLLMLNPIKKDRNKQLEKFKGELQVKQSPKSQVPTEMAKEPCLAEELGFKSPSGLKLKRQLKTGSTKENGGDESRDKTTKESLSPLGGAKGTGPILQENENLRDFQNRLVKSYDRSNQNLQVIKVENDELLDSPTFTVPIPDKTDLKYMTMNQLRAVARHHNVHGVYKFRKAELQEHLHKLLAKGRST